MSSDRGEKLMVTISVSEYTLLNALKYSFRDQCKRIDESYKDRIDNLERTIESMHERIMRLKEAINNER